MEKSSKTPIEKLALEVADVVNATIKADANKDGKISGGEVTQLIFKVLGETPQLVQAVNETIAHYKGQGVAASEVIKDVIEAVILILENLDIVQKDWIVPTSSTLRVGIAATTAGDAWMQYANGKKD